MVVTDLQVVGGGYSVCGDDDNFGNIFGFPT